MRRSRSSSLPRASDVAAAVSEICEHIETVASEYVASRGAPGISIAVHVPSEGLIATACGYSDPGRRLRCAQDTRFCVGSITKQFTAAAILQLIELGRLSLDSPVVGILPELRPVPESLHVRYL